MSDPAPFRRQRPCRGCGEAIDPGSLWGCLHRWVPVAGFLPGMVVEVHAHYHLRCAKGETKWELLRHLGHTFREEN